MTLEEQKEVIDAKLDKMTPQERREYFRNEMTVNYQGRARRETQHITDEIERKQKYEELFNKYMGAYDAQEKAELEIEKVMQRGKELAQKHQAKAEADTREVPVMNEAFDGKFVNGK